MKTIIKLFLYLILLPITGYTQTIQDTTVKSSWYLRVNPFTIYTSAGQMIDKTSSNIEIGKSIGVMDFGLVIGKITYRPDTNNYVEARATMNVGQYGIFSNELIIGGGYVFKSAASIMFELSTTMFGQITDMVSVGVITGYYDFSGISYSTSKNLFGLVLRYGCQRNYNGGLVNGTKGHMAHKHRFHR